MEIILTVILIFTFITAISFAVEKKVIQFCMILSLFIGLLIWVSIIRNHQTPYEVTTIAGETFEFIGKCGEKKGKLICDNDDVLEFQVVEFKEMNYEN